MERRVVYFLHWGESPCWTVEEREFVFVCVAVCEGERGRRAEERPNRPGQSERAVNQGSDDNRKIQ